MRKITVLLAAVLLGFTTMAHAQLNVGVTAGLGGSKVAWITKKLDGTSISRENNFIMNFSGGGLLTYGIPIAQKMKIEVEGGLLVSRLGFGLKGTKTDFGQVSGLGGGTTITEKIETYSQSELYIQIPVVANFRFDLNSKVGFFGGMGPQIGIGVMGWVNGAEMVWDGRSRLNVDWKIQAGAYLLGSLRAAFFYDHGLTNKVDADWPKELNRTLGVSFSYFFL